MKPEEAKKVMQQKLNVAEPVCVGLTGIGVGVSLISLMAGVTLVGILMLLAVLVFWIFRILIFQ